MFETLVRSIAKTVGHARKPRRNNGRLLAKLRGSLRRAVNEGRLQDALDTVQSLESLEPGTARWPHKRGDFLRQLSRQDDAFFAYAAAVRLYVEMRRPRLAAAMARTALAACPDCSQSIAELDEATAQIFQSINEVPSFAGLPAVLQ
jgi:uncharacterized protein Yka (UPF0111/DUF47 family)